MDLQKVIDNLTFKFPMSLDEYLENPFIENHHYHSSFSNTSTPDSPTSNQEYCDRIKQYGAKCMFSGEHGSQGNQFEVHSICEENGLKYRHSVEAYWVKDRHENDSSNCHIQLVAINDDGRKDINYILSIANTDGYYYKPRIDLELLLSIPKDNVIVTSACIGGWKYQDAEDIWLKIWEHFGDNFFFEVQYHNTESQKSLNKRIAELSKKYGIQMIVGLDSHYLDETDSIKRNAILEDKNIHYEDEVGWYLDYPNFDTVYDRFIKQGILTEEEICYAMLNTLVFDSDKVSECVFNKDFKIPCIYKDLSYDERCKLYKDILYSEYEKEPIKSQERVDGIEYEASQVINSGVVDYFLTTRGIIQEAIKLGGVLTTTSRGSMSGFYTNKLLGLTTVDRFNSDVPIYAERFLTEDRVKAGQMPDCDLNIVSQEPFLIASKNLLGEHGCYPLMAVGMLQEKSSWKMYARINNISTFISDKVSKAIDKYYEDLKYADDDEKDLILIEDYIPNECVDIYNMSKQFRGIVDHITVHACGHLLFDGDIRREIGLISAVSETTKKRSICACVEGKYLDAYGYVKEDYLIVDSVALIKECWDSIGEEVPTFEELKVLIKNNKPTWDIYANGITCCINQMEKTSTTKKCMTYKPQNLTELACLISAIRPGFVTLVNDFINRKDYSVGEPLLDDLLNDTKHWMLFQESIMKVLNYLGLEMGETYAVIKNISKKKYKKHPEKLKELQDKLKKDWLYKFGNLDNFDNVWGVIDASALYCFNSSHAYSMGGDSAYLAYFKANYTSKFYEVAINHYQLKENKNKVNALLNEAYKMFGYESRLIKFGDDNRAVKVDDINKTITPSMTTIKGMQSIAPRVMLDIANKQKYDDLDYLFFELKNSELNKKSISYLFKLDYFSDFGDINYIENQWELYNKVYTIIEKLTSCKQLNKETIKSYGFTVDELKQFCNKETANQLREIDNDALSNYVYDNYSKIKKYLGKSIQYNPTTILDKIQGQLGILGATELYDETIPSNIFVVGNIEENKYGTRFINIYNPRDKKTISYKVNRRNFEEHPCDSGDIIKCVFNKQHKRKQVDGEWVESEEIEEIIKDFSVVKKFQI